MALNPEQIAALREGGQKLTQILDLLVTAAKPGVNLLELEAMAQLEAEKAGGNASFKGYQGYPAASCLSVNEGIVHCIPQDYTLKDGDVITIDMGLYYQGIHTDSAITVPIGNVSPEVKKLLSGTYQALLAGVNQAKAGNRVEDISSAIETVLEEENLTIFRDFTGHQIGTSLHDGLIIPNFTTNHTDSPVLEKNIAIAIEPIAGLGDTRVIYADDGWTANTSDGKPAAHYEMTVLIGENGAEIITPIGSIVQKLKIS